MGTGPGLETREEFPPAPSPLQGAAPQSAWLAGQLVSGATVLTSGRRVNCRLPAATHTRGAGPPTLVPSRGGACLGERGSWAWLWESPE